MKNLSDNLIGIMTDPGPDLLTGLFGIIKSGNGFVPIDPTQPNERLGFIIDDCQIAILLTQDKHLVKAIDISEKSACLKNIVCLDKITQPIPDNVAIYDYQNYALEKPIGEKNDIKPEQPVYVIYTSDTTGVPKGVPISQQNLLPLLDWSREYFKFDEQTTVLQNLNYAFDFGVFELLTTSLFGGTLHIRDKEAQLDALSFVDYMNELMINTIHTTPSFFRHIASRNNWGQSNIN
jgi:non-ribosomal peptide synthetase component F